MGTPFGSYLRQHQGVAAFDLPILARSSLSMRSSQVHADVCIADCMYRQVMPSLASGFS